MPDTLSIEQFTADVAAQIASQLKIDTSVLVEKLVTSLSKNLVDKILINKAAVPITQEKSKTTEPRQKEVQDTTVAAPIMSRAAEQAIAKIPVLASILAEVAKNTKEVQTKKSDDVNITSILKRPLDFLTNKLNEVVQPDERERDKELQAAEKPKTFLQQEEKDQKVLFDGFTENGLRQLMEKLPVIIKTGLHDLSESLVNRKGGKDGGDGYSQRVSPGGLLKELKGLGSLLTGLTGVGALIFGLETDGPFKGLAKIASEGLLSISGWTKSINKFASGLVNKLLNFPFKLIKSFEKSFAGLIGKEVGGEVVKTGLGKLTGFTTTFLAGATKILKKVPIVGSLISLAFAFSRFKQGDIVGGGLEILSGIASLFPGIGTGISIAVDGLTAFLDYKAGGTSEGGGKGKGAMLTNWVKDFSGWAFKKFEENIRNIPVVGPLIKSFEEFKAGNWVKGLKQLAYTFPLFDMLGEILGDTETTGSIETTKEGAFKIGDFFSNLTNAFMSKVRQWWKSISSGLRYIIEKALPTGIVQSLNEGKTIEETTPKTVYPKGTEAPQTTPKTIGSVLTTTKLSDATTQTSAIGEEQKESTETNNATIAPEESTSPAVTPESDKSLDHLSKLAANSDKTNETLSNLVLGFNTLAKALEKLGVSVAENPGNTTNIFGSNKSPGPVATGRSSEFAKAGDPTISQFRSFIEQARQQTF
jgi:hypothetical protein